MPKDNSSNTEGFDQHVGKPGGDSKLMTMAEVADLLRRTDDAVRRLLRTDPSLFQSAFSCSFLSIDQVTQSIRFSRRVPNGSWYRPVVPIPLGDPLRKASERPGAVFCNPCREGRRA